MFPRTICLSSLLSLLIMTQTPHFHALSHGNHWTAGSTVISAIEEHSNKFQTTRLRSSFMLKGATGHCPGQDEDSELSVSSTIPNGRIERKVFCHFYNQQAWSYNSENISLPVAQRVPRVITAYLKGFGKSDASVTVVGYRRWEWVLMTLVLGWLCPRKESLLGYLKTWRIQKIIPYIERPLQNISRNAKW